MEVNLEESQAARFAVMQYIAMLKRMPEGSLREKFNLNDSIVVGGVGTVPFPNADHYVQERELSIAFNPRAGIVAPTAQSPSSRNGGRFPGGNNAANAAANDKKLLPSAMPVESKPTIVQMEMLLRALGASTAECVTTNDYAVKLYQNLDRYFDLAAEISGNATKLRRAFGTVGFASAEEERKARESIKAKLGATDGSPSSLADAQKKLAKANDRIRDMSETIERLRGVKTDIALLQDKAKSLRETCASVKQTARFQLLDLQDFLSDQSNRLRALVGSEALRATGVSGGGINAAKKAALEAEIKKMKDDNPLRDGAAVLRLTLECALDEMRRVLRAPLDPSRPVEDSDDDDGRPTGKKKAAAAKSGGNEAPRRVKPNCAAQAIKHEVRLPKVDLQYVGWDTLKPYDKPGTELDLLKEAKFSLKALLQMQKLMSQWHVDHSQSTSTINGLRHEVDTLTQQLAAAKEEASNSAAALAAASKAVAATAAAASKGGPALKKGADAPPAVAPKEGGAGKAPPPTSPAPGSPKGKPAAPAAKGATGKSVKSIGAKASTPKVPAPASTPSFEAAAGESTTSRTETTDHAASTTTPRTTTSNLPQDGLDTFHGGSAEDKGDEDIADVTRRPLSATHRGGGLGGDESSLPASPILNASDASPTAGGHVEAPSLSLMQSPTREHLPPLTNGLDDLANSIHATNGGSKGSAPTSATSSKSVLARKSSSNTAKKPALPATKVPPSADTGGMQSGVASGKTSTTTTPRPNGGGAAAAALSQRNSSDGGDARSQGASQSVSPALTPGRGDGRGGMHAHQQALPLMDTVRLHSLFLEIGAQGIPKRLGVLLENIFKIIFPGDPRVSLIRSGVISNEKEDEVFQRLTRRLPSLASVTSPGSVSPPPTELLPPNLAAAGGGVVQLIETDNDPLAVGADVATSFDQGGASLVSQSSVTAKGKPRRYSRAASSSVTADEGATAVDLSTAGGGGGGTSVTSATGSVTPPLRSAPSQHGSSASIMATPSKGPMHGSTAPGSTPPVPQALQRQVSQLARQQGTVGEPTEEELLLMLGSNGGAAVTSAFPDSILDAAALYNQKYMKRASNSASSGQGAFRPIAQVRQLRDKFAPKYKTPPTMMEVAESAVDDPMFEKRKEKFVELTRKLLSDLPALKRSPPRHPLTDLTEETPTPPLLFAPARQFPPPR